jgi:hypothetical protein
MEGLAEGSYLNHDTYVSPPPLLLLLPPPHLRPAVGRSSLSCDIRCVMGLCLVARQGVGAINYARTGLALIVFRRGCFIGYWFRTRAQSHR